MKERERWKVCCFSRDLASPTGWTGPGSFHPTSRGPEGTPVEATGGDLESWAYFCLKVASKL